MEPNRLGLVFNSSSLGPLPPNDKPPKPPPLLLLDSEAIGSSDVDIWIDTELCTDGACRVLVGGVGVAAEALPNADCPNFVGPAFAKAPNPPPVVVDVDPKADGVVADPNADD